MTKIEVLKKCPFMREMNDEQFNIMVDMCHEEVYEVGECLGKQGRLEEKLFLIQDGLVGLYLELGPMSERLIQSASNCELVGLGAVFPGHRYTVTMKAIETTRVLVFDGQEVASLCDTNPRISCRVYRAIAQAIATRLKNAYTQLMGVTIQDF